MTAPVPEPVIERLHCNSCDSVTKHERVYQHKQEGSEPIDDEISVWWETHYALFECRGCETVLLRRTYYFSEWDREDAQITYFPPQLSRTEPSWLPRLVEAERELLTEIYTAIAADSRRIAVMGARALLDMFIVRKVGDQGSFDHKLARLQSEGILSARNAVVLQAALDAGHASSHRGYKPSRTHVAAVMDIVESLLHSDLLHDDAADLQANVPIRPRPTRTS